jgi:predicted site-specific integrase-resolvase
MRGNIISRPGLLADENHCTRQDIARLFKVCPRTVSRWAKAGHIPALSLGAGAVRYDFADVLTFLALR